MVKHMQPLCFMDMMENKVECIWFAGKNAFFFRVCYWLRRIKMNTVTYMDYTSTLYLYPVFFRKSQYRDT
ncbi:hypothetical protein AQUCO_00900783v1 [Aquilegia coerulea]|uniref:Uncharacterized protein n=1 Tax=Aquilegia coerulea TaxID=218851 RepID=A0A2G5EFI9_AQUCA|nr:hypothetical protein AQUCO_00900783v1 [Aquilegia coerulea]